MADDTVARYARLLNDIELVIHHDSDKLSESESDFLNSLKWLIESGTAPRVRQITMAKMILKEVMTEALKGHHYVMINGIPIYTDSNNPH